jgi:hypothetical protein
MRKTRWYEPARGRKYSLLSPYVAVINWNTYLSAEILKQIQLFPERNPPISSILPAATGEYMRAKWN